MQGIFLDIETTGLNPVRHHPINIAFKVVDLSTGKVNGSYQSLIRQPAEAWEKRDPKSIEINGFTWAEVMAGKDPELVGKEIISTLSNLQIQRGSSVFICQNPAFDRGFFNQLVDVYVQELLNWPYHWLDLASMFWATQVMKASRDGTALPEKISLSKNDIAAYYHLPAEECPHRAMRGVDHLILCYNTVMTPSAKG